MSLTTRSLAVTDTHEWRHQYQPRHSEGWAVASVVRRRAAGTAGRGYRGSSPCTVAVVTCGSPFPVVVWSKTEDASLHAFSLHPRQPARTSPHTSKHGRHSYAGAGAADRWSCGCVPSTPGMLAARAALLAQRQHVRVHGPHVDKDVWHVGPAHDGEAGE